MYINLEVIAICAVFMFFRVSIIVFPI